MRIVLDTNVLVSGLLTPFGAPAQIVRMVASGHLVLCHDARVLVEYEDVLRRPKFDFAEEAVVALLDQIRDEGTSMAGVPLPEALPDPDDEAFLEVALESGAEALVTGNLKHYPSESRQGMSVVSPREFLDRFKEATAGSNDPGS